MAGKSWPWRSAWCRLALVEQPGGFVDELRAISIWWPSGDLELRGLEAAMGCPNCLRLHMLTANPALPGRFPRRGRHVARE